MSFCFVTGSPFERPPKHTNSCSDCLNWLEHSMYTLMASSGSGSAHLHFYDLCCKRRRKHLGHIASSWPKDNLTVIRLKLEAWSIYWKSLQITNSLDRCQCQQKCGLQREQLKRDHEGQWTGPRMGPCCGARWVQPPGPSENTWLPSCVFQLTGQL